MTTALILLMCWATLMVTKGTPAGRFLNRVMVDMPTKALSRIEPGHIALALVVTMLIVVQLNSVEGDAIRLVSIVAPEIALLLTSLEISLIVEASIALVAVLTALRRVIIAAVLAIFSLLLPRHPKNKVNRARSRVRRSRTLPANDDEEGLELALAS